MAKWAQNIPDVFWYGLALALIFAALFIPMAMVGVGTNQGQLNAISLCERQGGVADVKDDNVECKKL